MITSRQLRAARALAGIDQRALAKAARLSLPTIQRMEASDGVVRGNVESLMKLIAALDRLGIELINEGAASEDGREKLCDLGERWESSGTAVAPAATMPKYAAIRSALFGARIAIGSSWPTPADTSLRAIFVARSASSG